MAVSGITPIATVETVRHLAAFSNGTSLYGLWTGQAPNAAGGRTLTWRKYGDPVAGDVRTSIVRAFETPTAIVRYDGALVVVYGDSSSQAASLWSVVFSLTTGSLLAGPVMIGLGTIPALLSLPGARGVARLSIAYLMKGVPRIRESSDGGLTWSGERPVLNAKVGETTYLAAVPFDSSHISLMQVGTDARILRELSSISRSRPVVGVVPHPTIPGKFYVVEAVHRIVTAVEQIADNERGYLSVLPDGTVLTSSRVRVGVSDAYGDVMLVDATGIAPVISASAVAPSGASPGADVVTILANATGPGSVLASTIFAGSNAAIADVVTANGFAYFSGYTDQAVDGALAVLRLSDNAVARPLTGVPVRCLDLKLGLLVLATQEGGREKLRFYSEGGLTPALLTSHFLPARANAVSLAMTDSTHGLLYVSSVDRLNIYKISGLTSPIQLVSSFRVLTLGSFFQHQDIAITSLGYIVAAVGNGGVAVFNTQGETLSQVPLSGIVVSPWVPSRVTALNDIVKPTSSNFYTAQRKYFKCTVVGTTSSVEPAWAPFPANVPDSTVTWQEVGPYEGVVTGVTLDEPRRRIIATGLAGGPSGTIGKVWLIDAAQVIP